MSNRNSQQLKNKKRMQMMQPVLDLFTSPQFLTANSLFNNLYSSQQLKIDLSKHEYLKTMFGTKQLSERQLYQFSYFHKRDRKMLLFTFLMHFLSTTPKIQMVLFLNNEKLDNRQLQLFLTDPNQGGKPQLWQQFKKRVIIYHNNCVNTFLFNLQYLWLLLKTKQFIKVVYICDINGFESNDKNSLQKYYKKLPKQLITITSRKQFYQYKIIQKSSFSYLPNQDNQQIIEVNEKVIHYLHKKSQLFSYRVALVVPAQYLNNNAANIQETFKSVILRVNPQNDQITSILFETNPFKLQSVKDM